MISLRWNPKNKVIMDLLIDFFANIHQIILHLSTKYVINSFRNKYISINIIYFYKHNYQKSLLVAESDSLSAFWLFS